MNANRLPNRLQQPLILASIALFAGCSSPPASPTGTLQFRANGEDFIRQGFVSKDGWNIEFDRAYITFADVTAYQTNPPFNPQTRQPLQAKTQVRLEGAKTIDLAAGDEKAEPILIGEASAPAGQYNALSWKLVPASSGEAKGHPLWLSGRAIKNGKTINFTLKTQPELAFRCGEFIGDERKGFLAPGQTADLEATFHFDHLFGDNKLPADDALNRGALGFAPFAAIAKNGQLNFDSAALHQKLSPRDSAQFREILPSLAHVGEGHCRETLQKPANLS